VVNCRDRVIRAVPEKSAGSSPDEKGKQTGMPRYVELGFASLSHHEQGDGHAAGCKEVRVKCSHLYTASDPMDMFLELLF
jgi:hypothetical protein